MQLSYREEESISGLAQITYLKPIQFRQKQYP